MKAIIKYPGSKWSMAEWIISRMPEHHSYLEPFFGSGAVLFHKDRSNIETINDLDGDVVNLFEWIQKDPEQLAHAIYFTPYARDIYDAAFANRYTETDPLRRALNFCIRLNMGHGFRTSGGKVGWKNDVQGRESAYAVRDWHSLPERLVIAAERLRLVQIENSPAQELIQRFNYPNVLIYADPPYLLSERYGKQYCCEMTQADHVELLRQLKEHRGPVMISGYPSKLYDAELRDWNRESKPSRNHAQAPRTEVLWSNF